jgi:hypothetical protein
MVTTSKDKVQCFKKAGYVTCKDNVTGRQLRKKNGVNATPGTIRVKKSERKKKVVKTIVVKKKRRVVLPKTIIRKKPKAKKAPARPAIKMTMVGPKKKVKITKAQRDRLKKAADLSGYQATIDF